MNCFIPHTKPERQSLPLCMRPLLDQCWFPSETFSYSHSCIQYIFLAIPVWPWPMFVCLQANKTVKIWTVGYKYFDLFWQSESSKLEKGCNVEFQDTFIKYVFRFFRPIYPRLAIKLAKNDKMSKTILWQKFDLIFFNCWKNAKKVTNKCLGQKSLSSEIKIKLHFSITVFAWIFFNFSVGFFY